MTYGMGPKGTPGGLPPLQPFFALGGWLLVFKGPFFRTYKE